MSHKSPVIESFLSTLIIPPGIDPHVAGYVTRFNEARYYEAHDVLEDLWLKDLQAPEGNGLKGLIQFAGAFVHLQKNRLKPADQLFILSHHYLSPYPDDFQGINLSFIRTTVADYRKKLSTHPSLNPWSQTHRPILSFHSANEKKLKIREETLLQTIMKKLFQCTRFQEY